LVPQGRTSCTVDTGDGQRWERKVAIAVRTDA
jgi:hypothetical protein